jgi:hypothetical protein
VGVQTVVCWSDGVVHWHAGDPGRGGATSARDHLLVARRWSAGTRQFCAGGGFRALGGSIADAVDRRKLVLVTSTGTVLVSVILLVQAVLQLN